MILHWLARILRALNLIGHVRAHGYKEGYEAGERDTKDRYLDRLNSITSHMAAISVVSSHLEAPVDQTPEQDEAPAQEGEET